MKLGTGSLQDFASFEQDCSGDEPVHRNSYNPILPAVLTVLLGAVVCALMLRGDEPSDVGATRVAANPLARSAAADPYGRLLDPAYAALEPVRFARNTTLRAAWVAASIQDAPQQAAPALVAEADANATMGVPTDAPLPAPRPPEFQVADLPEILRDVPVPAPRPPEFRLRDATAPATPAPQRLAQQARKTPEAAPPTDTRGIFEKLFGGSSSSSGPALAYASPESDAVGNRPALAAPTSASAAGYDRATAIYDISAHTVYLPNGARLEAHSGLGPMLDDVRSMRERNRGVTPPSIYDLSLREKSFHGVQAIRLNPAGDVFGRTGLLAHTYMLGPNGDSNGCVSFRDYDTFLQAFMSGQVKRLAVVASLK